MGIKGLSISPYICTSITNHHPTQLPILTDSHHNIKLHSKCGRGGLDEKLKKLQPCASSNFTLYLKYSLEEPLMSTPLHCN